MKLVFDPNQEFQHDAIEAVLGLFKGIGHQGGTIKLSQIKNIICCLEQCLLLINYLFLENPS